MKTFLKCPKCGKVYIIDMLSVGPVASLKCWNCDNSFTAGQTGPPLKALSIQQPWAWAIVAGLKDIENRTWATKVTGTVMVHAGHKFDKKGYEFLQKAFKEAGRNDLPTEEEFKNWMGGIVGHVDITECVTESKSPWFFGPYGFTLENAQMIDIVRCKGQLSFFIPKID